MHEAEGVAGFVRRQLTKTGERHFVGSLERIRIFAKWIEQALGDQKVLADAERVEVHVSVDDFAGARIANRVPISPTTSFARHPFDDVVADVHGIDALGQ